MVMIAATSIAGTIKAIATMSVNAMTNTVGAATITAVTATATNTVDITTIIAVTATVMSADMLVIGSAATIIADRGTWCATTATTACSHRRAATAG